VLNRIVGKFFYTTRKLSSSSLFVLYDRTTYTSMYTIAGIFLHPVFVTFLLEMSDVFIYSRSVAFYCSALDAEEGVGTYMLQPSSRSFPSHFAAFREKRSRKPHEKGKQAAWRRASPKGTLAQLISGSRREDGTNTSKKSLNTSATGQNRQ